MLAFGLNCPEKLQEWPILAVNMITGMLWAVRFAVNDCLNRPARFYPGDLRWPGYFLLWYKQRIPTWTLEDWETTLMHGTTQRICRAPLLARCTTETLSTLRNWYWSHSFRYRSSVAVVQLITNSSVKIGYQRYNVGQATVFIERVRQKVSRISG